MNSKLPKTLSAGVKRPISEDDYSPASNAQIKNMWIYASTSPYAVTLRPVTIQRSTFIMKTQIVLRAVITEAV